MNSIRQLLEQGLKPQWLLIILLLTVFNNVSHNVVSASAFDTTKEIDGSAPQATHGSFGSSPIVLSVVKEGDTPFPAEWNSTHKIIGELDQPEAEPWWWDTWPVLMAIIAISSLYGLIQTIDKYRKQ